MAEVLQGHGSAPHSHLVGLDAGWYSRSVSDRCQCHYVAYRVFALLAGVLHLELPRGHYPVSEGHAGARISGWPDSV